MEDSRSENDECWGCAFQELEDDESAEAWKPSDVRDLIRKSVVSNCAETIRRFGDFGAGDADMKVLPGSLFGVLDWNPSDKSTDGGMYPKNTAQPHS